MSVLNLASAWWATVTLAVVSVLIQSAELIPLRTQSRRHRWAAILSVLRLVAAGMCWVWIDQEVAFSAALGVLLLSYLLSLLWGGAYNGGSDSMTLLTWVGISVGSFASEFRSLGLAWIAVQLTASYFLSGFSKVRVSSDWRSGEALSRVLQNPRYCAYRHRSILSTYPPILLRGACWVVLGWEVFFPLVWLQPAIVGPIVSTGVLFHLGNAWLFGLNRFFWAWIAAYPALVFWVGKLHAAG